MKSKLEGKQENKQETKQEVLQENIQDKKAKKINPKIAPQTGSMGVKKVGKSVLFLWAAYALSILLIILVVCDNWQP